MLVVVYWHGSLLFPRSLVFVQIVLWEGGKSFFDFLHMYTVFTSFSPVLPSSLST